MSVPAAATEEMTASGGLTTLVPSPEEETSSTLLETPPEPGPLQADEFEHEKRSAWIVRKLVGVCVILISQLQYFFCV